MLVWLETYKVYKVALFIIEDSAGLGDAYEMNLRDGEMLLALRGVCLSLYTSDNGDGRAWHS